MDIVVGQPQPSSIFIGDILILIPELKRKTFSDGARPGGIDRPQITLCKAQDRPGLLQLGSQRIISRKGAIKAELVLFARIPCRHRKEQIRERAVLISVVGDKIAGSLSADLQSFGRSGKPHRRRHPVAPDLSGNPRERQVAVVLALDRDRRLRRPLGCICLSADQTQ